MYISLVWLRAIAPLLVFYDHIFGIKIREHGGSIIVDKVDEFVLKPFGIIQDFGFLGVSIFFIISGFIISHVIQRESMVQFILKRIFRIYPALILSIIVICILNLIIPSYSFKEWSIWDIGLSMTLLNYMFVGNIVIQGVAWTLIIEVLFYISFVIVFFVTKSLFKAAIGLMVGVFVILLNSRELGDTFFLFSVSMSYLPYLISGIFIYLYYDKKISSSIFLISMAMNFSLIIFSIKTIQPDFLVINNSYLLSYIYGLVIAGLFLANEKKLTAPRIVVFYNNISYSFYLYHGVIGFFIVDACYKYIGLWSVLVAFLAVSLISFISYKTIEIPMSNFCKILLRRIVN